MSGRLHFQKMCIKYALDFQSLNSSNEDVYTFDNKHIVKTGHNEEEPHLIHTAATCIISLSGFMVNDLLRSVTACSISFQLFPL